MSAASHLRAAASKVTMQQRAAKAFHSDAQDTYFTPRIPPEVKEAIPLMAKLEHAQLRRALQLAVEGLNGRTLSEDDITALQPALGCDGPDCDALVTALYVMVRMAVRAHTKLRAIEKDLTEMHVPEHLVKDIVHVVRSRRHELVQAAIRSEFSRCTVLTIAHRLHTIADSDRVLVLHAGEVREFAPPAELLADPNGAFRGMVDAAAAAARQQGSASFAFSPRAPGYLCCAVLARIIRNFPFRSSTPD